MSINLMIEMLGNYNLFAAAPSPVQYSYISKMKEISKLHQTLFIVSHHNFTVNLKEPKLLESKHPLSYQFL